MRTFILGCAAAALIACGGRMETKSGLEGPTVEQASADYPTGDYGYDVGQVVPNLAFLGYSHLDPTSMIDVDADPIGTVHMSDYYDPAGVRGLTYLVVAVQVVWCGPSNEQDDFTNGGNWTGYNTGGANFALEYASSGVRFMTLLQDGTTVGTDATVDDLQLWVKHHTARTTQALISHAESSIDVVQAAVPYNMIVQLQTMRIVAAWVGFDTANTTLKQLLKG